MLFIEILELYVIQLLLSSIFANLKLFYRKSLIILDAFNL